MEIAKSEWLVLASRGFGSEEEAGSFGRALKSTLELSAAITGFGIDTGHDRADSMFSQSFKDEYFRTNGRMLRDSVHGLDVLVDNPLTSFVVVSAKGSVLSAPEPLLTNLHALFYVASGPSERLRTAFLLLNSAGMLIEPLAQVVVAIAAVEFLSQGEKWTLDQKQILRTARESVESCELGTPLERREVYEAIEKLHRLSVRQSVRRLLSRLHLTELNSTWDQLYSDRSGLFHGSKPEVVDNAGDLAIRAQSLCRQVLLRALALEVPAAGQVIESSAS